MEKAKVSRLSKENFGIIPYKECRSYTNIITSCKIYNEEFKFVAYCMAIVEKFDKEYYIFLSPENLKTFLALLITDLEEQRECLTYCVERNGETNHFKFEKTDNEFNAFYKQYIKESEVEENENS